MNDTLRGDLIKLSREINADPELAYKEERAVGRITALLEKNGHQVERNLGGLPTAFRARVGPPGPAVALLAEYDALPDVGHGCGHNLISMTIVGAFLTAAAGANDLETGIELVGTPAGEINALTERVEMFGNMAKGAALQTGTRVKIEEEMRPYLPVEANPILGEALARELVRHGKSPSRGHLVTASGDIGNVSQKVPTDYIGFPVSAQEIPGHSHKMREASVSDYAHESAFVVIDALAATALRVATDKTFRESLRT